MSHDRSEVRISSKELSWQDEIERKEEREGGEEKNLGGKGKKGEDEVPMRCSLFLNFPLPVEAPSGKRREKRERKKRGASSLVWGALSPLGDHGIAQMEQGEPTGKKKNAEKKEEREGEGAGRSVVLTSHGLPEYHGKLELGGKRVREGKEKKKRTKRKGEKGHWLVLRALASVFHSLLSHCLLPREERKEPKKKKGRTGGHLREIKTFVNCAPL